MKFQKYTKYKASGVDWLGEIPEEWEVKRLKDLGLLQNGVSEGADYFGKGSPFVDYGNVYNDTINIEHINSLANSNKSEQKLYSVKENDVFFTRTSETVEEIGFSGTCLKTIPKAVFSGFVIRLRANPKLIKKDFSKHFFKAQSNRNFFTKEMNIVTRASLSQGLLNKFPVLIPPKQTQTKIANYLDEKTNLIDKKISLLQKKKEKYKELKQTLINEVVTKGLDNNVKMKESEIKWIGEIPKHWEVKRLKDISSLFTGNSISNKELFVNKINSYPYIATKDININTQKINYDNGIYIPKDSKDFKIAKENSILLCIEGANAGKKIAYTNRKICFVNKQCSINGYKIMFEKFLFYAIQEGTFKKYFFSFMSGLIGGVSINLIKRIPIIIPPKQEQIQIANYLDEKTKKIDDIIEKIDENIEVFKEFRKTLINDAVTGKIKVA